MGSPLAWLDSSSASRRKAMEVIKLFEEKGTVDEIGIGSVRDALSDALFPGTSVLHTRARYLLIVPWVYQYLEGRKIGSASIAKEARKVEVGLIDTLMESDDHAGTIGRVARSRLRFLPSAMYWSALNAWGLKPTDQSQDQYHRSLDRYYRLRELGDRDDDGQPIDGSRPRNWHAGLPSAPKGFPRCDLSLTLTRLEADYLRERILTRCTGSMLAYLVDACLPTEGAACPWEIAEVGRLPASIGEVLEHARNFSETILGAALLYNVMLADARVKLGAADGAEGRAERPREWLEQHTESFGGWADLMADRRRAHDAWDREAFWRLVTRVNPRLPLSTRVFVESWLRMALAGNPGALRTNPQARRLVADRERAIKGRLARLANREPLLRWQGFSGARQLDYRWGGSVAPVTADIQRGLRAYA